jgi:hypothetical protein
LNVEGAADVAEDIEPSGVVLLSFFVIETKTTIMGKRTKSRVISDVFGSRSESLYHCGFECRVDRAVAGYFFLGQGFIHRLGASHFDDSKKFRLTFF